MALSEQEQRLLDEMERSLYQSDADFMSTAPSGTPSISARAITTAVLIVAVSLGIVIAGIALRLPLVGLIGFVVMVVGLAWAFSGSHEEPEDVAAASAPGRLRQPARGASGGFMDRLEDRWEQRRRGDL